MSEDGACPEDEIEDWTGPACERWADHPDELLAALKRVPPGDRWYDEARALIKRIENGE
jgi:hypothetical protein